MPLLKLFSSFDSKVKAWTLPFFLNEIQGKTDIIECITAVVNDPKSDFFSNPEDYTFFEIGTWDVALGVFTPHESRVSIGNALLFKDSSTAKEI